MIYGLHFRWPETIKGQDGFMFFEEKEEPAESILQWSENRCTAKDASRCLT